MAYFTHEQLQGIGHLPFADDIQSIVAAPDHRGLGFSVTDVLGGIGSVVGNIFGGKQSSGGSDQAQIAAMIAAQQAAERKSNETMLMIGGGLALLIVALSWANSKRGRR